MPDSGKWHTEMDNPEVIKYKLGDLKEDIDELKKEMKSMSKALNDLTNVHSTLHDHKKSLDLAWDEIRAIQETCMIRQHQIDWVRQHERDESPQDWWERVTSSSVSHGVWIVISVIIAIIITNVMG